MATLTAATIAAETVTQGNKRGAKLRPSFRFPDRQRQTQLIILRNLPDVQFLEHFLILHPANSEDLQNPDEQFANRYTQPVFGNTIKQTKFEVPESYWSGNISQAEVEMQHDAFEEQFETKKLSDDEIVSYFLPHQLDFRDEQSNPLRGTLLLARAAEAALKGIAGALPKTEDIEGEKWKKSLQQSAHKFMQKRGKC